jgi:enoyl-CoA hydratase/carnithine racemase
VSSFYQESFSKLSVKKDDTILWLGLDNPESSNAITLEVVESLTRVLSYADFDPEIRVIILAGKGKVFCSGGDVKAMVKKEEMFAVNFVCF